LVQYVFGEVASIQLLQIVDEEISNLFLAIRTHANSKFHFYLALHPFHDQAIIHACRNVAKSKKEDCQHEHAQNEFSITLNLQVVHSKRNSQTHRGQRKSIHSIFIAVVWARGEITQAVFPPCSICLHKQ
jgi:hypothetical protein